MNNSESVVFKPLSEKDINLIYHWFQEPIINQWYARGRSWSLEEVKQKYLPRIQGKDHVPSFIIYKDDHPIGFIQYYHLTEHFPEGVKDFNHPLFKSYQANELLGIDLFVAHQKNRGIGYGPQILNDFMLKLPTRIRAVIVDPNSNNYTAIRCYIKAGFQSSNYSTDKDYVILIKALPHVSEDSR